MPSPPIVSGTQVVHPHGQSAPSIVTFDALASQQAAAAKENKHASSNAAKKVMDWFRRKSYARDTLSNVNAAHIRSDSTSSFVQVSGSPARKAAPATAEASSANLAMSSTSSFARTTENTPNVAVAETLPSVEPTETTRPGHAAEASAPEADSAATEKKAQPHLDMPSPARSISHNPAPNVAKAAASSDAAATRSTFKVPAARATDDSKMRLHNGVVNQSALSSKPPKEVMDEVLKVLQDMGIDIKRENEYRLRCTRVRKRKAGATTGLGLGSVMSVGSTMGGFSLLGNASSSRVSLDDPFDRVKLTDRVDGFTRSASSAKPFCK